MLSHNWCGAGGRVQGGGPPDEDVIETGGGGYQEPSERAEGEAQGLFYVAEEKSTHAVTGVDSLNGLGIFSC